MDLAIHRVLLSEGQHINQDSLFDDGVADGL
jgi:hypothetical protein